MLDGVTDNQHDGLIELQKMFRSRSSQKATKFADILGKSRETQTIEEMSHEVPGKYDDEVETARAARDTLVDSTRTKIHNLLGPELVDGMNSKKDQNRVVQQGELQTISASTSDGTTAELEITQAPGEILPANIDVPQPISPSFPKRGAAILALEEGGIAIIDALYNSYRESYDHVRDEARLTGKELVQNASLSLGARIKQARAVSDEASEAVAELDTKFFSDLAVVTGVGREDENLLMLEHYRQRQRGSGADDPYGWSGSMESAVDLVELYFVSRNARTFQEKIATETANVLRQKLHSYHERVSELYTDLAQAQYELTHMQEAMQVITESGNSDAMMETVQQKWQKAFVDIRNAKNALMVANQKALDDLLSSISDADHWQVRMRYMKQAYPNIFRNSSDTSTMLTAALAIQNLGATQRDQLEQLSTTYNYEYWNLCEEMIANRQLIASAKKKESLFDQSDMQREIQMEKLRFKRSELANRAKMRLRMILAKEQIKDVPGLRPSVTAVVEEN